MAHRGMLGLSPSWYWVGLGLLVPLVGVALISYVGPEPSHLNLRASGSPAPYASEIVRRIAWYASTVALIVGMVAVVLLAATIIAHSVEENRLTSWMRTTLRTSLVASSVVLGLSLLDQEIGLTSSWTLLSLLQSRAPMVPLFHALNCMGAIPTVFVVSAVCASVHGTTEMSRLTADRLRDAICHLRMLVYLIGIVLAVATIEMYLACHWGSLYLAPRDRGAAHSMGIVLASGLGVLYTVFLAVVFIPAMVHQRRVAYGLATRRFPGDDMHARRRKWLDKEELQQSPLNTVSRVIAVFGPLITGGLISSVVGLVESAIAAS